MAKAIVATTAPTSRVAHRPEVLLRIGSCSCSHTRSPSAVGVRKMLPHLPAGRKRSHHSRPKGLRLSSFRLIPATRTAPDEPTATIREVHDRGHLTRSTAPARELSGGQTKPAPRLAIVTLRR